MASNPSVNPSFVVFFRTSKVFGKSPIDLVDSRLTFCSLLESFSLGEVVCIADNATDEQSFFFARNAHHFYRSSKGNSGSFRLAVDLVTLHPADIYYFVEDDHLHLPRQKSFLAAGLKCFDFVSLYDHPDKYQSRCYPGLQRQVFATSVGHFSTSPSTVMTFACRSETLYRAREIMLDPAFTGQALKTPRDHEMFIALAEAGFTLGTALPGRSTHCERELLSPYVDWSAYALSLASKYRLF